MEVGTPAYPSHPLPRDNFVAPLYENQLRQDNPGTRVTFVSFMVDPDGPDTLYNYHLR